MRTGKARRSGEVAYGGRWRAGRLGPWRAVRAKPVRPGGGVTGRGRAIGSGVVTSSTPPRGSWPTGLRRTHDAAPGQDLDMAVRRRVPVLRLQRGALVQEVQIQGRQAADPEPGARRSPASRRWRTEAARGWVAERASPGGSRGPLVLHRGGLPRTCACSDDHVPTLVGPRRRWRLGLCSPSPWSWSGLVVAVVEAAQMAARPTRAWRSMLGSSGPRPALSGVLQADDLEQCARKPVRRVTSRLPRQPGPGAGLGGPAELLAGRCVRRRGGCGQPLAP